MQRKESMIEVKVGALVLLSLVLFGGFVFLMGDFRFGERFAFYIDFDNAGGLKPGADVRVAGIPTGRVKSIEFLGGSWQEDVNRHVYVRVQVEIDREMHQSVGHGAQYIITTLSVLGEPYIEIVNTVPPGPPIAEDSIHFGQSPVRIDEMIRSAYRSLRGLDGLIVTIDRFFAESDLERLLTQTADLAERIDLLIEDNSGQVEQTLEHLEFVLSETRQRIVSILSTIEEAIIQYDALGASLNNAIGDGSDVSALVRRADTLIRTINERMPTILASAASSLQTVERIAADSEGRVSGVFNRVDEISDSVVLSLNEVNELVTYVSRGRGTIGALLRDDELYDDVRELVRELKRRPWRLIWKE